MTPWVLAWLTRHMVIPLTENIDCFGGENRHEEEDNQFGFGNIELDVPLSLLGEPS